jgi:DNA polymerase III alpha subunit (gram-positive type)
MKVLIFDSETGGTSPKRHSVMSVGWLAGNLDTGEIFDTFEAYHKLPSLSDYIVSPGAIEIHSITPEKAFAEGVTTEVIQEAFADFHTKHSVSHIGGHNVPFDVEFFTFQIFKFAETEQFRANFGYRMIDSLSYTRLLSGLDDVKSGQMLKQACKAFNIDMSDYSGKTFHGALFDSVASFRIMHKFRRVFSNPEIAKLLSV